MSQLDYALRPAPAIAGQLGSAIDSDIRSAINQETVALPFGIAMALGVLPVGNLGQTAKAKLLASAADAIVGVTLFSDARDNIGLGLAGIAAIKPGDTFNLLAEGDVWVPVEQAVVPGDPVYVRFAPSASTPALTQAGAFRKDADGGTAKLSRGSRWLKAGAAGGIALLRFDGDVEQARADEAEVRINHPQAGATTVTKEWKLHPARYFLLEGVDYVNPTGLEADPANYFVVQLLAGTTVLATWSTQAGQQGVLPTNGFVSLALAAPASLVLPPGTEVQLSLTKAGTATLPPGSLFLHGRYIG
jgi:hypothetical protein